MKKGLNKNDRRYAYTHGVIKDAMLELLHQISFNEVTVSSLCRQAQVGRATFYTHYDNLTEVIEELVEDAIKATDRSSAKSIDGMRELARYLSTDHGFREMESKILLLPICQLVADNPRYNVLFRDSTLSEYILTMIYRQEKDYQIAELKKYGLTEKEADMLFTYMLSGSFAVNKALGWKKDEDWMRVQRIILNFVCGGMDALEDVTRGRIN
ncbi:MAG: TetR/AcrR family transcriptional regulator [Lachnospiraceae bacterium]|nr:TetR/AcrR family transcriptional regulator [Lachnospiraceae bacterium]